MYKFLIFFLFVNNLCFSNSLNRVCTPKTINNYEELDDKLKICDSGNRLILNHSYHLSKEKLIGLVCDLRFTVIFDTKKDIINTRKVSPDIVCIYLPHNEEHN